MQGNILKLSFLMAYLTMLIGVVSGIPFMTALFRSILLMAVFSMAGFLVRWYLLKVVTSVEPESMEKFEEPAAAEEEEESFEAAEEPSQPGAAENIEESNLA